MGFFEGAGVGGAGGGFVAPAVKFSGHFAAVHFAAAAEGQFVSAALQTDEDHGGLGAGDRQRQVDDVFGVVRRGASFFEVAGVDVGVNESAVEFGLGPREGQSTQPQSADRVALIEVGVDVRWRRAGVDQSGDDAVGLWRDRWETEPTGVGGDGGVERHRHRWRKVDAELIGGLDDQVPGGFGGRVFVERCPQVVLADMVIEHHFVTR